MQRLNCACIEDICLEDGKDRPACPLTESRVSVPEDVYIMVYNICYPSFFMASIHSVSSKFTETPQNIF